MYSVIVELINNSKLDDSLLTTPPTLKEHIAQYKHKKEIFDLKERHDIDNLDVETSLLTILQWIYLYL